MTKHNALFAILTAVGLILIASGACAPSAIAEVHFGKNVRIGGHDVSNQTFNQKNRGEFYVYDRPPPNPGCHWRTNKDGSRTKVCHFERKADE